MVKISPEVVRAVMASATRMVCYGCGLIDTVFPVIARDTLLDQPKIAWLCVDCLREVEDVIYDTREK